LIIQWNKTWTDYPANSCIHELFEVEAERRPQAVALVTGNQLLTYAELNRRANQLAHYLQTLGVGAEAVVATYLERSPQMIVALLAILKAGGSYMPLDVANPKRRLALILQDSDARVLLTDQQLPAELADLSLHVVRMDLEVNQFGEQSDAN